MTTKSANPMVSVIMACHNEEQYIAQAVDSILNQTFTDLEFIIINDCSIDETLNILNSYTDPRLKVFSNSENKGLTSSLNMALEKASGKYIARMDADDISLSTRLEEQLNIMEKNPEICLCGTYATLFGKVDGIRKHDTDSDLIKSKLIFSSQFCHPTVMLKAQVLRDHQINYNIEYKQAQDYDLWVRLIPYCEFYTIDKPLIKYRVHADQVTAVNYDKQSRYRDDIIINQLKRLNIFPSKQEFELHKELAYFNFKKDFSTIVEIKSWLERLVQGNELVKFYPTDTFKSFIASYFFSICYNSTFNGLRAYQLYYQSSLSLLHPTNTKTKAKFLLKSLLKR